MRRNIPKLQNKKRNPQHPEDVRVVSPVAAAKENRSKNGGTGVLGEVLIALEILEVLIALAPLLKEGITK